MAGSRFSSSTGNACGAGDVVEGPAVVQEFGSTVPIPPGFRGTVDRFGNLLLTRVGP